MIIKKPKTVQEYVELIDQAIFEVEELRMAMEYDQDSMGGAEKFIDELEAGVRGIKQQMKEGTYQWATGDLPFMDVVKRTDSRLLPFKELLHAINHTHKTGLDA